jgi:hypothetical protein
MMFTGDFSCDAVPCNTREDKFIRLKATTHNRSANLQCGEVRSPPQSRDAVDGSKKGVQALVDLNVLLHGKGRGRADDV